MAGPSAPGGDAEVDHERCRMCGAVVPIGPDGRCVLGHRVRPDDTRVVASYAEPAGTAAPPLPLRIPDRLRMPLPGPDDPSAPRPPAAHLVPVEDIDDAVIDVHAANAAAFAAMVAAGDPGAGTAVAVLPSALGPAPTALVPTDERPTRSSVLDVDDVHLATPPPMPDPAYEQAPLDDDPDLLPPRTLAQRVLAVLFVLGLLVAAWYLATSL